MIVIISVLPKGRSFTANSGTKAAKIYGPKFENGNWRIRYNMKLKDQYKSPDIVAEIKTRRLEWLGHVIRMEDEHVTNVNFKLKI